MHMTSEKQTQAVHRHPYDPILFKMKFAFFFGVCGADRDRYFAIKGRLIRAAASLGLYECENLRMLRRFVAPGDTVLDIGANAGVYSVALARLTGASGAVIAFEPLSFLIPELTRCTRSLPAVSIEVAAVGKSPQPVVEIRVPLLYGKIPEPALATLQSCAHKSEQFDVVLTTIDQYRNRCPRISFIKMDVEGHELEALQGGRTTLLSDRPVIQFESNKGSPTTSAIDSLAMELRYIRAVVVRGTLTPLIPATETMNRNHYLIPAERSDLYSRKDAPLKSAP